MRANRQVALLSFEVYFVVDSQRLFDSRQFGQVAKRFVWFTRFGLISINYHQFLITLAHCDRFVEVYPRNW